MKVVLLAGGLGTRLTEETVIKPKPMVEIGGQPILWHIMQMYAAHGLDEFIVCCGYKGWVIKEFFASYYLRNSDVTVDMATGTLEYHRTGGERWKVTLVDTGEDSLTGGRLRRVGHLLDDTFCFTYGDGVSDVDITKLVEFHRTEGRTVTLTAVQPTGRYGAVDIDANSAQVNSFQEKPAGDGAWVNGGFFVCEPSALELLSSDHDVWENEPLRALATKGELSAYRHYGFWYAMDTLADKQKLESIWATGNAPWKCW